MLTNSHVVGKRQNIGASSYMMVNQDKMSVIIILNCTRMYFTFGPTDRAVVVDI